MVLHPLPLAAAAHSLPLNLGSSPDSASGETLLGETLLSWRRRLLERGGRSADFDWLLDLAAGLSWSALQRLRLEPATPILLTCSRRELEAIWYRHLNGAEPLQYLVGVCPWRDIELRVAPGVLIPRQETEVLVDLALASLACGNQDQPAVATCDQAATTLLWADLGTGSGCVALALARALPRARGLAVDRSDQALAQAQQNLARYGLDHRVALGQGDWWEALEPWWGQLDLVVSNPPYIPSALLKDLDPVVRDHEPWLALDGGPDGLGAIRAIAAGATRALAPGGMLLLEHHHDQSAAVLELLAAAGLQAGSAHRDLEGTLRFARAFRSSQHG